MLTKQLGPDIILDFSVLQDVDVNALATVLTTNNLALTKRINETAKRELRKGRGIGADPAFISDPDFLSVRFRGWYDFLYDKVCSPKSRGSVVPLLLPTASYLYDSYGLSCSKLILGCEMPTVPPLWLRTWLEQIDLLPLDKLQELQDMLHNAKPVAADTIYVLKSRILEIAAERGIPTEAIFLYHGIHSQDFSTLKSFSETEFYETGNAYTPMQPFLGNHKMLRYLIVFSYLHKVSPDYLLLQDYSNFAVTENGRYYSPAKRQAMSMLLQTDTATRNAIVGFVMAQMAKRKMNGESIPHLQSARDQRDNGTLHTLEAIYAESQEELDNNPMRRQREAQVVETLKPKLWELIQLSGEPVSSTRLFEVVDGHIRLARRALHELEREGKIRRLPTQRQYPYWESVPNKKVSKK